MSGLIHTPEAIKIPETINIIEPTLMTETGHCFSFLTSLCSASKKAALRLWINRNASVAFAGENIEVKRYFFRKIRRIQCYVLYKKLLATKGKLFISTAGITDLVLLDWASKAKISKGKVYLYFHWLNISEKKIDRLRTISRKQPNLTILGPTPSVINAFQQAGFENARIAPYPISVQPQQGKVAHNIFTGILYAGAARQDKGISEIVDLVEYMNKLGLQIPFRLQNSPDHRGKYDAITKAEIQRLEKISYPHLRLYPETLGPDEYARLFAGAICIQLYNAELFSDRISGVTLDALTAGSPIVATASTWIARMVRRFDAGKIVESTEPENVLSAIREIISDYSRYSKNAYKGGQVLQQENSAEYLFNTLLE
jgi:glycosyltransferase involved in cell wall biosynthesis